MSITIDASVWTRLKETLKPEEVLRVGIASGGCFGFQYTFKIDTSVSENDEVWANDEQRVVIAKKYIPFLQDGTLLFEQSMMHSQFSFQNPQADKGCGCGLSFALPEDKA